MKGWHYSVLLLYAGLEFRFIGAFLLDGSAVVFCISKEGFGN